MAFSVTKTNYEYFYALKRMPKVAEAFRNLVDLVEHIWFGAKAATREDLRQCREQALLVEDGLPPLLALHTNGHGPKQAVNQGKSN